MATGEIIELLSSDEEVPLNDRTLGSTRGLLYSQNDFDTTLHLNEDWETGPAKRRKTSHSNHEERQPTLPVLAVSASKTGVSSGDGWTKVDDDDPIIFTSSTHQHTATHRPTQTGGYGKESLYNESEDSLPEDIAQIAPRRKITNLSERTAALLAALDKGTGQPKGSAGRKVLSDKAGKSGKTTRGSTEELPSSGEDVARLSQTKAVKPKKTKLTVQDREARQREKEEAKDAKARQRELTREERAKEKDDEKEQKRNEREKRAEEKRKAADLAEANKTKIDKKDSTPEMIVDLPVSIDGSKVDTQAREMLKNVGVEITTYQSWVPNIVKWRRKIKRKWNANAERWEPIERMVIEDEKHILCYMPAKDFANIAMAQTGTDDIETHVTKLKTAYEDCIPIYLIEGLHNLINKSKNTENRAYQARVLAQDAVQVAPAKPRKQAQPVCVNEEAIEDALLSLQVMHGCLVHQTPEGKISAEWIMHFTQHISTVPYKYFILFLVESIHANMVYQTREDEPRHDLQHGIRPSEDWR